MMQNFLHFTPCGLVLDACGVLLLGLSFFLKTTDSMIEESGTTWDSKAYITVASSKSDGIFGSLLLFLGFIYQTLGYSGVQSKSIVIVSYAALIIFLFLYLFILRKFLINKWVADIEARFNKK